MKKLISTALIIFSFSLLLTGCGGGGEGESTPETDTTADGGWQGTITENGSEIETSAHLYEGRMFIMKYLTEDDREVYGGTYLNDGNTLSATLFSESGNSITILSTVKEQESIEGTYSSSDGTNGTLSLTPYDYEYEDRFWPSSSEQTVGSWTLNYENYEDDHGPNPSYDDIMTSITVSNDGTINGTSETGCIFSGTIITKDMDQPEYLVDISVSNCGTSNGNITGLATYEVFEGVADELYIKATLNNKLVYWPYTR